MVDYSAPLWDIRFALSELADVDAISTYPDFENFDVDIVEPMLDEAARFIEETVAPLNRNSDQQGSCWHSDHSVTTPDGFVEAYKAYSEAGWQSVPFDPAYGGGGFPWVMSVALQEMLLSLIHI